MQTIFFTKKTLELTKKKVFKKLINYIFIIVKSFKNKPVTKSNFMDTKKNCNDLFHKVPL